MYSRTAIIYINFDPDIWIIVENEIYIKQCKYSIHKLIIYLSLILWMYYLYYMLPHK